MIKDINNKNYDVMKHEGKVLINCDVDENGIGSTIILSDAEALNLAHEILKSVYENCKEK